MAKIDVCIDPFFPGMDAVQKIKKLYRLGINAIEFWYYDHEFSGTDLIGLKKDITEISLLCQGLDITINDIVVNSPDSSIGGSLTKPEDRDKYIERLKETIDVAHQLNCKKMITCTGNLVTDRSFEQQFDSIVNTLGKAVQIVEKEGVTLLLEALNSHVDHPGYFLISSRTGFDIIKQINSPNLKFLYDIYHMQIMEGNHISKIRENISLIGHFHSAGVPGRNELYKGEISYIPIIEAIDEAGYNGYFGLEYFPSVPEEESLTKTLEFLKEVIE